jgi:hypothetical protein
MHFKIKASFIGESHNLLENKTYGLYEQRIDEGVDDFSVLISGMLFQDYLILDKEMRDVVIQIDIFRDSVNSD